MKYQVVYESQSGNTEQLAKAIASCFPENQVNLVDINLQTPSKNADIYCIGFGVRHSLCSMRLIDFLECLNNKTIHSNDIRCDLCHTGSHFHKHGCHR